MRCVLAFVIPTLMASCSGGYRGAPFDLYNVQHESATNEVDVSVVSSGLGEPWSMQISDLDQVRYSSGYGPRLESGAIVLDIARVDCTQSHIALILGFNDSLELHGLGYGGFVPTGDCPPLIVESEPVETTCDLSYSGTAWIEISTSMDRIDVNFEDLSIRCGLPDDIPSPRLETVNLDGTYSAPLEYFGTITPI